MVSATVLQLNAQERRPQGPPQAAFTACENLNESAQCSFSAPHGTVNGTCINPPNHSELVCAPEGGPPGGPGHEQNRTKRSGSGDRAASAGSTNQRQTLSRRGGRQNGGNGNNPRGGAGRPETREHSITQISTPLYTYPSNTPPIGDSQYSESSQNSHRQINANGISEHDTGTFPNDGNPNTISEQRYAYTVPLQPAVSSGSEPVWGYNFGIGVNGVPFDPGAAEWYLGERNSEWQYAALSGAVALGLDDNHAHVQPTGAYHYHGKPTGLLSNQGVDGINHSPIIGWAADGFPIYALYGYQDGNDPESAITILASGYQIKPGNRPSGSEQPGGYYDGTFVADYEYIEGLSELDECNGRTTVTPDYPDGTYAYFITENWPVIPRCFKGTPDTSFRKF